MTQRTHRLLTLASLVLTAVSVTGWLAARRAAPPDLGAQLRAEGAAAAANTAVVKAVASAHWAALDALMASRQQQSHNQWLAFGPRGELATSLPECLSLETVTRLKAGPAQQLIDCEGQPVLAVVSAVQGAGTLVILHPSVEGEAGVLADASLSGSESQGLTLLQVIKPRS